MHYDWNTFHIIIPKFKINNNLILKIETNKLLKQFLNEI